MDGNGRWAAAKGLPRLEGHRRGAERLIEIVDACINGGIGTLTVFAFSAENWKRPLEEVSGLFKLGEWVLRAHLARLEKRNVRLRVIGDIGALPEFVRTPLEDVVASTRHHTGFTLVVALNYGARQEIVSAAQSLATDVAAGKLLPAAVDWSAIEARLQTAGLPDPDLIIRTSGEFRLSNFLLLQSAYAEIVFASVFWPDFDKAQLQLAIAEYAKRERRFGLTSGQIQAPAKA
ncbi:MAG: di-trans,poly-cis-decaprenylcistransferase [Opitutia bacterium]|nr:di-trans,poly-cis-decaprenylcistransferase [Opitutales bacterium]PHX79404.1 MAG: di-trans,poly-cis-decaprenylcistransferase [Opitutae bacterium]